MKKLRFVIAVLALPVILAACSSSKNAPVLFGQGSTIGLSVGSSPAEGGVPSLTFGYKAFEVASVPTLDGEGAPMGGVIPTQIGDATDAYSVFGGFGTDTAAEAGAGVDVGITTNRFFSVGQAAAKLADGEACRLSRGTDARCTGTGGPAFSGAN